MRIQQKILLRSSEDFLDNFANIYDNLLKITKEKYPEFRVGYFGLYLSFPDKKIRYDSYNEFLLNKDNLNSKEIEHLNLQIKIYKGKEIYSDSITLDIETEWGNLRILDLSIGSNDTDLIGKIFGEIVNLLPGSRIYQYDSKTETKQKIEQKIKKCGFLLENLNKYQLRMTRPFRKEKELQDFIFPILKSHFEDLEDEFHLPKFGNIEYKPDFGIPSAKLLIECKFLQNKKDLKKIQKEIHDDIIGYLNSSRQYSYLIVFIYNSKNIPIADKFKKDINKNKKIKLIIVPGVNPN